MSAAAAAVEASGLRREFVGEGKFTVRALDGVTLRAASGSLTALVGADGAGKTTLMRCIAGLLRPNGGTLRVLDIDVAAHPQRVQDRISYMPQRFGLYEDLSVQENLDLYADLHGVSASGRAERYPRLMEMTALGPFKSRLAGKLSGGMKQKLGLACTLVRSPELLLLDEPTVGVDPLSRRELWEIVHSLVAVEHLTVLLSTAYLEEAERCAHIIMLHQGRVLYEGPPADLAARARGRSFIVTPSAGESPRTLQARLLDQVVDAVPEGGRVRIVTRGAGKLPPTQASLTGARQIEPVAPRLEDGFMLLIQERTTVEQPKGITIEHRLASPDGEAVIHVRGLQKKFGAFTAVDRIAFEVHRGEIFGLLGPNGAGKTTTFRMLCGLLVPSAGELWVAGQDVRRASAAARGRLGYVAQKFSLYGPLSVLENLEFFASAYGLRGEPRRNRISWAMDQFDLADHARTTSSELPGGYQQRLAMAAALLHEPEILFLDEPTSGADPRARRLFWRRITALAEQGVTIIITTHFMQEAEYCDAVAIMDSGRILAQGTPAQIRALGQSAAVATPTMDDAFIAVVERARRERPTDAAAA